MGCARAGKPELRFEGCCCFRFGLGRVSGCAVRGVRVEWQRGLFLWGVLGLESPSYGFGGVWIRG